MSTFLLLLRYGLKSQRPSDAISCYISWECVQFYLTFQCPINKLRLCQHVQVQACLWLVRSEAIFQLHCCPRTRPLFRASLRPRKKHSAFLRCCERRSSCTVTRIAQAVGTVQTVSAGKGICRISEAKSSLFRRSFYEDKDKSSLSEVLTWHLQGVDDIYREQYFCLWLYDDTRVLKSHWRLSPTDTWLQHESSFLLSDLQHGFSSSIKFCYRVSCWASRFSVITVWYFFLPYAVLSNSPHFSTYWVLSPKPEDLSFSFRLVEKFYWQKNIMVRDL